MVYSRFVGAHMSQKGRCDTVSSFQQIFLTRICPGTCSNIAFDKKKIRWRFINRCNNNNNKMDVNLISEYVEIMSAWIIIIKQISWMVMPKGHDRPLATNECVCVFFFAVALWSFWLRRRQKWQHFFVVAFLVLTTLTVAFFAVFVGTVVVAAACAIITNEIHDQMPRSNKDLHGEVKIEILQHYLWIWLLHDCFQYYLFECWEILMGTSPFRMKMILDRLKIWLSNIFCCFAFWMNQKPLVSNYYFIS